MAPPSNLSSPSSTSTSPFASALLACSTFALLISFASSEHIPFGYQSDSTHSWEHRNAGNDDPDNSDWDPTNNSPHDPSSYVGSIHYDPLHHALYVTGNTFASGVFDGVDVYGLTTSEAGELADEIEYNDGYWWEDSEYLLAHCKKCLI